HRSCTPALRAPPRVRNYITLSRSECGVQIDDARASRNVSMMMRLFVALAILAGAPVPKMREGGQAAAAYDPQGVHVDAKGVLRSRSVDPDPRLAELWKNAKTLQKDAKFLYVSLPRLFAEARRTI